MRADQKPRRRHSEQFKAQVLAACAEPGASVSAVALSFGVNGNLVHQWRRGRGYKPSAAAKSQLPGQMPPPFVALALPAPSEPAAPVGEAAPQ
jgi:transposase